MNNKDTLILAIGSGAMEIVDILYNHSKVKFLYLDIDKQVINTNETKTIWYSNLEFQKTEYDFEEYKNILLNRTSKFNELVSKYKDIVVVSCIGEKFSSDTLFEVIKYLNKLKINHSIFTISPFDLEGKNVCHLAIKALGKLTNLEYSLGKNLYLYKMNEITKENPSSMEEAIFLAQKKSSEILSMILELNNV